MSEVVKIEIQLDDGTVKTAFGRIEKDAKDSAGKLEKTFAGFTRSLSLGFLGIGATIVSSFAVGKVIEAAQQSEDAINKINQSLINAGSFSQGASKEFQNLATELQNLTGISDEAVLEGAAIARQFTRTNEEAQKLVRTALDLSAATGGDLTSSIEVLGKTLSGSTGLLSKTVVELKTLTTAQLKNGDAIDIVAAKYQGFAESQGKTTSGQLKILNENFGDLLENLGKAIIESPVFIKNIELIASSIRGLNNLFGAEQQTAFSGLEQSIVSRFERASVAVFDTKNRIEELKKELATVEAEGGLANLFAPKKLRADIKIAENALTRLLQEEQFAEAEFNKILEKRQALAKLRTPTGGVGLTQEEIAKQISFEQQLSQATGQRIQAQITGLKNISDAETLRAERSRLLGESTVQIEREFIAKRTQLLQDFNDRRIVSQTELNNLLAQLEITKNLKIAEENQKLADNYSVTFESIKSATMTAFLSMDASAAAVGRTLSTTFVTGFTQAFSAIGNALATGKNAFESFGDSIFKTLGSLAIQLGQFFILIGFGLLATQELLGLKGGAAIAAGVALQVFGGFLQGIGGGGGDVAGAGGGGSAGGGGPAGAETPELNPEQLKNNQRVVVNIQGDVLDSDETGTRIAAILTEKFQAEGVDVVRAV